MVENAALDDTTFVSESIQDCSDREDNDATSELCVENEPASNPYCDLLSQIVEDVTANSNAPIAPEVADNLALNVPFARSVFLQYLAAKGTVEERLRQAIMKSVRADTPTTILTK